MLLFRARTRVTYMFNCGALRQKFRKQRYHWNLKFLKLRRSSYVRDFSITIHKEIPTVK
jgi:hypothetical protein